MTARAEQRVRHRRRVTGRRAVTGGAALRPLQGDNAGKEPAQLGVGPDGTSCRFSSSDITYQ
ncbi:hypothetical protein [Streptomyces resistomycificus]|uniref:hypothetical protein n=1 Tax=Streptomyces resistomycificus TaxID=67356 RepID=UPI0009960BA6|nr:hypothetical protein [Streptomyces resistomycificus]